MHLFYMSNGDCINLYQNQFTLLSTLVGTGRTEIHGYAYWIVFTYFSDMILIGPGK